MVSSSRIFTPSTRISDVVGVDARAHLGDDVAVDLDPAVADHPLGDPARGNSRLRQHLLQPDAFVFVGHVSPCPRRRPAVARLRRHAEFHEPRLVAQGFGDVVDHVDVGQQRCDVGQVGQRRQPQPLQEQLGGRESRCAGVGVGAGLGDQPARQQRPHHRVDVDAAHRADPRPGHRLPVGDHGQRLQRGAGQLRPGAVEQQPLDVRRVPRPGVHPPAAAGLAQVDAAVAGGELVGHQRAASPPPGRRAGRSRRPARRRSPGCRPPAAAPPAPRRVRRRPSPGSRATSMPRSASASSRPGRARGSVVESSTSLSHSSTAAARCSLVGRSPVHETCSTPSGSGWSNATALARNSSSSARNRPTISIGRPAVGHQVGERRPLPDPALLEHAQQPPRLLGHRHALDVQVVQCRRSAPAAG